ncbi:MAG: tetratricopeptide repeat protein [candidate division WOR-3 bacterium]
MLVALVFLSSDDPALHDRTMEAMEYGMRERYSQAEALMNEIISDYPDEPIPYILKAALLDLYMADYEVNTREKEFYDLLKTGEKKADAIIKSAKSSGDTRRLAWGYFYKGAAIGFKAFRKGRANPASAVTIAWDAVDNLALCLQTDSTIYDAYYPLGMYDYAISELPKSLSWLPFIKDKETRKQKGMEELEKAWRQGDYTRDLAQFSLVWVYLGEGRAKDAYPLAKDLVARYPESRTFRWLLGTCQRRLGKWAEAEETYSELVYLVLNEQIHRPRNVLLATYWCAHAKYRVGKYEEALEYANFVLNLLDEMEDTKENRKMRDEMIKIKTKCEAKVGTSGGQ